MAVKTADFIKAVGLAPPIRQHDLPKKVNFNMFEIDVNEEYENKKVLCYVRAAESCWRS